MPWEPFGDSIWKSSSSTLTSRIWLLTIFCSFKKYLMQLDSEMSLSSNSTEVEPSNYTILDFRKMNFGGWYDSRSSFSVRSSKASCSSPLSLSANSYTKDFAYWTGDSEFVSCGQTSLNIFYSMILTGSKGAWKIAESTATSLVFYLKKFLSTVTLFKLRGMLSGLIKDLAFWLINLIATYYFWCVVDNLFLFFGISSWLPVDFYSVRPTTIIPVLEVLKSSSD